MTVTSNVNTDTQKATLSLCVICGDPFVSVSLPACSPNCDEELYAIMWECKEADDAKEAAFYNALKFPGSYR